MFLVTQTNTYFQLQIMKEVTMLELLQYIYIYISVFPQIRTPVLKFLNNSNDVHIDKGSELWITQVVNMTYK